MHVVLGYVEESGQALAEPHGDLSVHVHTKGLKAFLEATHGIVLESAGILAQIHMADLRHAKTANWDETWRVRTRSLYLSVPICTKRSCLSAVDLYISGFKSYHFNEEFSTCINLTWI